ncbi:MAG TPA: hypothetical protein VI462_04630 [Acidimicrobiia bacterium]
MHVVVAVLLSILGVLLILVVFDSALRTFVLPRGVVTLLTRTFFTSLRKVFDVFARESRTYEARDSVMALYGPLGLFGLVFTWMTIVILGFALIYKGALQVGTWHRAFELSGSSFFTLGFVGVPPGIPSYCLVFIEAGSGLGLLALLIAYLPTIYGAFSRRELAVAKLATRAGTPPSAIDLLTRYHAIGWTDQLPALWEQWEEWFADIAETHTSLGVLTFFRSPNPDRSWVTAAGALLDAASLAQSTLAIPWSPQAGLCIRAGTIALREIASFFGVPFDPDPRPDDAISIARSEWDDAYVRLGGAGVPVRPDRNRAWRDFAGWRVNYDAVLLGMAGITMAPYAPWSSDRSLRYRARLVRRRTPTTG